MDEELNADLIWALRAMAQDAPTQRELYPSFVDVPDELVSDYDLALSKCSSEFLANNPDIKALDAHILGKSGVLEYWINDALDNTEFWAQIRRFAKDTLQNRGISTFSPHRSSNVYISENGVYNPAERNELVAKNTSNTLLSKLRRLFH